MAHSLHPTTLTQDSYNKNKELHFLQMRENLRNSFMGHSGKWAKNTLSESSGGKSRSYRHNTLGNELEEIVPDPLKFTFNPSPGDSTPKYSIIDLCRVDKGTNLSSRPSKPTPVRASALFTHRNRSGEKRITTDKHTKTSDCPAHENKEGNDGMGGIDGKEYGQGGNEKMTSSLMKKYKSIEKIRDVIASHKENMPESDKKRSVSKHMKEKQFHVPTRNTKVLHQKQLRAFDRVHVTYW